MPSELVAPQRQSTMPSTSTAMSRKYRVSTFFSCFVYFVLKLKHHFSSASSGKDQTRELSLFRRFCPVTERPAPDYCHRGRDWIVQIYCCVPSRLSDLEPASSLASPEARRLTERSGNPRSRIFAKTPCNAA